MKAMTVLILLAFFINTVIASPQGEGAGASTGTEESNLSTILMVVVVVGFAALLVGDVIADDSTDSQDILAGVPDEEDLNQETGINWQQLSDTPQDDEIPTVGIAVFNFRTTLDRKLSEYFTVLLGQDEDVFYSIHGSPVSLGNMTSPEAAATGFAFIDCDWFVTGDQYGIHLFEEGSSEPVWQYNTTSPDSAEVRAAAASFRDFAEHQNR